VMLELPSVCEPGCSRFEDSFDDTIVFECWSKVPCFECVIISCAPTNWLEMHEHLGSHWCHWRRIERVRAFHGFES
jgi:hypothetical protein